MEFIELFLQSIGAKVRRPWRGSVRNASPAARKKILRPLLQGKNRAVPIVQDDGSVLLASRS